MEVYTQVILILTSISLGSVHGRGAQFCPDGCSCIEDDSSASCRSLKAIPHFSLEFTIQSLDLAHCSFSTLNDMAFHSTPRVQFLNLSSSNIKSVSVLSFYNLSLIREIDLSHNHMTSISPFLFFDNPVLESVSLKHNPLVRLSLNSPILISDSISILNMEHCKLSSITPATFSRLTKLKKLNLNNNRLEVLDPAHLTSFSEQLTIVELKNNLWRCNAEFNELFCWSTYKEMICLHEDGRKELRTSEICDHDIKMATLEVETIKTNALIIMWAVATIWIVAIAAVVAIRTANKNGWRITRQRQQNEEETVEMVVNE